MEFKKVDVSDSNGLKLAIKQLKTGAEIGFHIEGVFSQEEVDSVVKAYNQLENSQKSFANEALALFPPSFAQIDQNVRANKATLKQYFKDNDQFWAKFKDNFGVDFIGRIQKVLSTCNNNNEASVPKGIDNMGIYNAATFKEMFPIGKGGELKAHCGNYFHEEFKVFYQHLSEVSQVYDQVSYFTMLDPSDVGGELIVYDLYWENVKIRQKNDTTLVDENGNELDLLDENQVTRIKLKPGPGDMILFSGGKIWHKIEHVTGRSRRLTLGGFVSFSKSDDRIFFWS